MVELIIVAILANEAVRLFLYAVGNGQVVALKVLVCVNAWLLMRRAISVSSFMEIDIT